MRVEDASGRVRQRVVIDTNGWISAALAKHGAPAQVLRCVLNRGVPVFSEVTFAELARRMWKPKFDRYLSLDLRRRILHDASAAACWVDIPASVAGVRWSRDPDDDAFVHAALVSQARWLVSGDQDLLSLGTVPNVRILAAGDALREPGFCA